MASASTVAQLSHWPGFEPVVEAAQPSKECLQCYLALAYVRPLLLAYLRLQLQSFSFLPPLNLWEVAYALL